MSERDPEEQIEHAADELEERIERLGDHIDEAGKAAEAAPGGFDDPEAEEEEED